MIIVLITIILNIFTGSYVINIFTAQGVYKSDTNNKKHRTLTHPHTHNHTPIPPLPPDTHTYTH